MNQNQLAELFDTSKQNIGQYIANILVDKELEENSVVKDYFTTASDGKEYNVTFYSLDMILAIGFRVRSKRATQFRIWVNKIVFQFLSVRLKGRFDYSCSQSFCISIPLGAIKSLNKSCLIPLFADSCFRAIIFHRQQFRMYVPC
ncbi:MAG TPA: RhuM family protein [Hanamia sp.]